MGVLEWAPVIIQWGLFFFFKCVCLGVMGVRGGGVFVFGCVTLDESLRTMAGEWAAGGDLGRGHDVKQPEGISLQKNKNKKKCWVLKKLSAPVHLFDGARPSGRSRHLQPIQATGSLLFAALWSLACREMCSGNWMSATWSKRTWGSDGATALPSPSLLMNRCSWV